LGWFFIKIFKMSKSKKYNVNLDMQGNTLTNIVIGSNADMTKEGALRFNSETNKLEYSNGTNTELNTTNNTNI